MNTRASSSDSSTSTCASLLVRVKGGDEKAWSDLVKLYGPLVHHWCRRHGLHENDTPDVFQEVFHAMSRGIGDFRRQREGDSFRAWLYTITKSKIFDHFRKQKNRPHVTHGSTARRLLDEQSIQAIDETDEREDRDAIGALYQRALASIQSRFAQNTWQAFWRTSVDGLNSTTVAKELDMSAGTVRVAKARVLRALREELIDSDLDPNVP